MILPRSFGLLALCSLMLPTLFLLHGPLSALVLNSTELPFARSDVWTLAAIFFAVWGLILMALVAAPDRVRRYLLAGLAAFAINSLIWNAAAPRLWLHNPAALLSIGAVEVAALVIVAFLLTRLPRGTLQTAMCVFASLSLGMAMQQYGRLVAVLPANHASAQPSGLPIAPSPTPAITKGNVYHVVLDGFPRDFLGYSLSRETMPQLEGFTFYENATSNYGRTYLSMRSVFRGELFPLQFATWAEDAFSDGFSGELERVGVHQTYFPFYRYFCHPKAAECRPTTELYQELQAGSSANFLIDAAFLQATPVSVRNVLMGSLEHPSRPTGTWDYGFSLTSWAESLLTGYPVRKRPIQSITLNTVDEFLEREASLPAEGRYSFLHVMVPHNPFVFDASCIFVDPEIQEKLSERRRVEEQVGCALHTLARVVSVLKELGRFDNSLIIVHSDHGLSEPKFCDWWRDNIPIDPLPPVSQRKDGDSDILPSQQVNCLASALLLVKKQDQKKFEVSPRPAQLVDIAPTILEYFGIAYDGLFGHSLLRGDGNVALRQIAFFETDTQYIEQLNHFSKFIYNGSRWEYSSRVQLQSPASPVSLRKDPSQNAPEK